MARIGSRVKVAMASLRESANKYNNESKEYFDIESLIKSQGIILVYSTNLPSEVSGKLDKSGNDWIITINKKQVSQRQRFTMAHEFAHFCLHKDTANSFEDITFFRAENSSDSIEKQANNFAAELLMPESLIRKNIKNGITSVSSLSEIFGVSPLAMKFRLKSLGFSFVAQ